MTISEFKHEFQVCGRCIQCETKEQRSKIVHWLEDIGLAVGESTLSLCDSQTDGDVEFYFSCLVWYRPLCSVSACSSEYDAIKNNGIFDMDSIASLMGVKIEAPSMTDEEFDEEFAKLIGA